MTNVNLDRKTLVKIISGIIISCTIAAALIGLGLLFNIIPSGEVIGKIMLSLLTVFIAGLFLLNSITAITVGNKFGIFSAIMILLSAVLYLVLIWLAQYLGDVYDVFLYIIVSVSMVSILLNMIVGHYIVLGKSLVAVQIGIYLTFAYIELVLSFVIFGNDALIKFWQIFVADIIVFLTLYIVLKVKEKNVVQTRKENGLNDKEYVTITKTEYENLKAEIQRLKELAEEKTVIIENSQEKA